MVRKFVLEKNFEVVVSLEVACLYWEDWELRDQTMHQVLYDM